jgi:lysophospholipase L1-like esterase
VLAAEVEALLDYRGGLEVYQRDVAWQLAVVAHYEHNLRRMTSMARQAGVPLILLNPACQLRDCPPFKAEHRLGMTELQQQTWNQSWDEARANYARQPGRAVQLLTTALAIDPLHAGLHYDLASCYDSLGQYASARAEYLQAKELDVCPLRILESMNEIVLEVGHDTNTPVVDLRSLFGRLSRHGIPGSDWFADHVHPTIPGYQRIADELAGELVRLGIVHPSPTWLERKEQRFSEQLDSLPTSYFVQGQQRLEALRLWANGRAK